ncbi:MAG: TIGR03915 family putative DNA repair protein [Tannerellaceae bacterium]|jgi:probable DNA metabolism protein|nr:TIGR03915 family putative DNA repair protein [Tannerellaceae bacterium]
MLVFRYDKSFEGLLTCLFDAYSRRAFPERLISMDEPPPLFAGEIHGVVAERAKAERVWAGLERRLTRPVCGMLMHVWLSELPQSDELLMRYMRKAFDAQASIATMFTDPDVLEVKKIAAKVSKERERLTQFARFQKAADGLFFAPVSPVYNALPLTLDYFTSRFADQQWLIYDLKRRYGYYYDLATAAEVTLDDDERLLSGKLNDALMAQDEKLFQTMWREYTVSLTIRERLNPALQRQHMPRRFWKYMPEKNL